MELDSLDPEVVVVVAPQFAETVSESSALPLLRKGAKPELQTDDFEPSSYNIATTPDTKLGGTQHPFLKTRASPVS